MGISDKLSELAKKAQDAVVEHEGQINQALDRAQLVADQQTGGRYREQITKAGETTRAYVQRLKPEPAGPDSAPESSGPKSASEPPAPGEAAGD